MVQQWYNMNILPPHKSLVLVQILTFIVRVRFPLTAHNISDLALKTWYNMVQHWPFGTTLVQHQYDHIVGLGCVLSEIQSQCMKRLE